VDSTDGTALAVAPDKRVRAVPLFRVSGSISYSYSYTEGLTPQGREPEGRRTELRRSVEAAGRLRTRSTPDAPGGKELTSPLRGRAGVKVHDLLPQAVET